MIKFITSAVTVAGITLFLTSCEAFTSSERKPLDKLDSVKVDTGIVKELKDIYRVFRSNDKLDLVKDNFTFYDINDSVSASNVLKEAVIKSDTLRNFKFYDDSIRILADKHLVQFNAMNNIIIKHGLQSQIFQDSLVEYDKISDEFTHYLFGKYNTGHFIKFTEDEYWKRIDKQQFIKSPEYARYLSLAKTDLKGSIELLKKIIANTDNFQERTIYQLELATIFINHSNKLGRNSIKDAIKIYSDILESKDYSLYKFEAWRRWRAASQAYVFGPNTKDTIPNNFYDEARENCASQILTYYVQHPQDEMALNQFLDFATHGVIFRLGNYEEGNQNMEEFTELFDISKK